ncbi:MAG: DNA mismatch repair endonuclease MutL [Chloroflexi bacterium]|nr:DNA mismatch repair endonuclease MutL [Chloroflexota bacterium]
MPIRQLAPDVAAKIAAGEVVERPASVVKELIENSIDAGATQIRVDLAHGGLQLIRITDNGTGIPIDELPLALARHATSKVAQIDDLEHIRSLGFRGEALASIAAVAEVTLCSRYRGAAQGAEISATNGQISSVTSAASPEGTTLTVRNLFSSVPARLKFLKSRNTEVSHCHHLLEQYALAYPEIRFSVFSDGRQIFATPGDGQLSSVLVEVYGLQIAEQMVPIIAMSRPEETEYPVVSGYVSRPACYKSTRQHISFFVNRRWVLSRMLTTAVDEAYKSLLLTGRHPIAVINIQIDPSMLDVNVHPAKTEIRFLKERRVFAAVLRAVREALLEEPEMPQWKPRVGNLSPGQSVQSVASTSDDQDTETPSISTIDQDAEIQSIAATIFPRDNPWVTVTEEETGTKPPLLSRLWQSHVHTPERPAPIASSPGSLLSPEMQHVPIENGPAEASADQSSDIEAVGTWQLPTISSRQQEIPLQEESQSHQQEILLQEELQPRQHAATSDDPPVGQLLDPQQTRRLPHLRVIGQLSQSYIVTEGEQGMYLIDQHAAHERILLERMVAALQARTPMSQLLLTPINLELAPSELEAIEDYRQQLEHIGFALEVADDSTLSVCAVPSVLVKRMNAHSLHELLVDLTAAENLGHTENWEEHALANVACKAAIKANYFLTVSEMREMIEQLEQTRAPYSCCHGRPTMVHFSLSSLEREFGRR